jgi:hypothetical protein
MGRPSLHLGTAGAIRIYKTDAGYRARVLVRDYDGRVRAVERHAGSRVAAERALKLAMRDRTPSTTEDRTLLGVPPAPETGCAAAGVVRRGGLARVSL